MTDAVTKFDELNRTINDFIEANDERVSKLEKNGAVDPTIVSKVDKANEAIDRLDAEVKAAIEEANKRQDDLEAILNRPAGMGGRHDEQLANSTAKFNSIVNADKEKGEELINLDVEQYAAYRSAFLKYARFGNKALNNPDVQNAMSVGSDADGGFWAPAEMSDAVVTRVFETSPMRQICGQITIGRDAFEYPLDTNDATSGGFVGETAARSDTATPQIGKGRIEAHEQFAQPKATQQLLDDAAVDVEGWLNGKIADKLTRTENTKFVTGDGVAAPRGFLDYSSTAVTTADASRAWGVLQYVVTGASGAFPAAPNSADPLINLEAELKQVYRSGARVVCPRRVLALVRKLKDSDGQYYWERGIAAGDPSKVLGYPITEAEDMTAAGANSFSLALGNFNQGYLIVDRAGIRILRDPFTDKPYVKFYTTKRVGGDVVDFDAIKLLKFGTS